ncbi:MAG: PadR family transcriptional regulator [Rothia sp. (in: high G+C Gram-positive bacteria)]|nr:PadR family transcriptional regulator [Rothia sp. (in: high G+C Gram-positive bacteria)]
MDARPYPPALMRALLPTAVLACLESQDLHGYGLAEKLEELGFGRLKGGSLYPALSKLEDAGAVTTAWTQGASGPARRLYTLTSQGRERLATERLQLAQLTHLLGSSAAAERSSR